MSKTYEDEFSISRPRTDWYALPPHPTENGRSEGKRNTQTQSRRGEVSENTGVVKEGKGLKACPHDPMDEGRTLKMRFRARDPDLLERRKRNTGC